MSTLKVYTLTVNKDGNAEIKSKELAMPSNVINDSNFQLELDSIFYQRKKLINDNTIDKLGIELKLAKDILEKKDIQKKLDIEESKQKALLDFHDETFTIEPIALTDVSDFSFIISVMLGYLPFTFRMENGKHYMLSGIANIESAIYNHAYGYNDARFCNNRQFKDLLISYFNKYLKTNNEHKVFKNFSVKITDKQVENLDRQVLVTFKTWTKSMIKDKSTSLDKIVKDLILTILSNQFKFDVTAKNGNIKNVETIDFSR